MRRCRRWNQPVGEEEGFPKPRGEQVHSYKNVERERKITAHETSVCYFSQLLMVRPPPPPTQPQTTNKLKLLSVFALKVEHLNFYLLNAPIRSTLNI